MKNLLIVLSVWFAAPSFAADAFVLKNDYQIIEGSKAPSKTGPVKVQEFFSYGCPWCNRLESSISTWRQKLPKNVEFSRVPVVFESGWEWYAKAYYLAEATNQETQLTPKIFKAIHTENKKLNSSEAMGEFLMANGLPQDVVNSGLTHSPAIDSELMQGMNWMKTYKVYSVPAVVVAGHYKTDLQLAKGDTTRLLQIVDFLIQKSKE